MRKVIVILLVILLVGNNVVYASNLPYHIETQLPTPGIGLYDSQGIQLHEYGGATGKQYNPLFIANDAIAYYTDYTSVPSGYSPNPAYRTAFMNIINWFLKNVDITESGLIMPYKFATGRNAPIPWYSAITQARVAKVFLLAYKLTGDVVHLETAKKLIYPIFESVDNNGFTYIEGDITFFEEYPKPQPDHVLNAHMSIILDLHTLNLTLKDPVIAEWINKGINSLKKVLPLYEMPDKMAFALCMQQGDTFADPHPIENTMESYDLIHLNYFVQLYNLTKDPIFEDFFLRYYAVLSLGEIYKKACNAVSPINGAIIESDSGFDSVYNLTRAFHNYRFDAKTFAVGNTEPEAFFVVNFGKEKEIDRVDIRFHWYDFARNFKFEGYRDGEWFTIFEESKWDPFSSTPFYSKAFSAQKVSKVKFTTSDYSDPKKLKLIMDYFYVSKNMTKSDQLELWRQNKNQPVMQFIDYSFSTNVDKAISQFLIEIETQLRNAIKDNPKGIKAIIINYNFAEAEEVDINKVLIDKFVEKIRSSTAHSITDLNNMIRTRITEERTIFE